MDTVFHATAPKCGALRCHGTPGSAMWLRVSLWFPNMGYHAMPGASCSTPQVPKVALQCHGALYNVRSTVLHATTPVCEALQCCRAPCQIHRALCHDRDTVLCATDPKCGALQCCEASGNATGTVAPKCGTATPWNSCLVLGHCSHVLGLHASPWSTGNAMGHQAMPWGTMPSIEPLPFRDVPQRCQP